MSEEVQVIITDVFKDTGVRLSPDDPIVAVLLAQSRFFNKALAEGAEKNDLFLSMLQAEKADILNAVAELKAYRAQVLTELVQENKHSIEELTDQVYVGVRAKLDQGLKMKQIRLHPWLLLLVIAVLVIIVIANQFWT
ncbi:MAG: hypothetical protein KBC57_00305 [Neisseriaceae bacterium]|nr:hypothetical protein [Neisseriaceae bacterium]